MERPKRVLVPRCGTTPSPCPQRHRWLVNMKERRDFAVSGATTFLGPPKTRVQIPSTPLDGAAESACPASQPETVGILLPKAPRGLSWAAHSLTLPKLGPLSPRLRDLQAAWPSLHPPLNSRRRKGPESTAGQPDNCSLDLLKPMPASLLPMASVCLAHDPRLSRVAGPQDNSALEC